MKFAKAPLSLDGQLTLLEGRGLGFKDKDRAKRYLTFISYYRLSGYFIPFQIPGDANHNFKPGVIFDDVLQLYIFDRKLRLLVLDALERIEAAFKAAVLNEMSSVDGSHWYLDPANFVPGYDHAWLVSRIKTDTGYRKPTRQNRACAHYYAKYTDPVLPPIWMVADVLSLGTYAIMFEQLSDTGVKKRTAAKFELSHKVLSSWMHTLTSTRNICAHHSRLWNKKFSIRPTRHKRTGHLMPDNTKLYAQAIVMNDMLAAMTNSSSWAKRLYALLLECPLDTEYHMGFPIDWERDKFWGIED